MIHRRALIIATTALLAGPLIAHGQQAVKMYRIGWLIPGSASPEAVRLHDAFRDGLRDFGYLEGRDYVIEFRWAHGHTDQLHGLAAQLVSLGVDVIVAVTSHTAHAAKTGNLDNSDLADHARPAQYGTRH